MTPVYNTRTDRNRNPAAFTTDLAKTGGLVEGVDFVQGDPFVAGGKTYYTAKLLGDPVQLTIKLIDIAGWQTRVSNSPRWTYMDCPNDVWQKLSPEDKKKFIALMYKHEGGTEMAGLFA